VRERARRRASTWPSCDCWRSSAAWFALTKVDAVDRGGPRTCGGGGPRARARRRGRQGEHADGRGTRRAPCGARPPRGSSRAARPTRPTRLYVDRSISLPGFGTVVTGTLWSGSVARATDCGSSRRAETCACAASRCTTATSRARTRAARRGEPPGLERDEVHARRGARRARRVRRLVPPRRRPRRARADRDNARVQVHLGTAHVSRPRRAIGERLRPAPLRAPVVAAAATASILRGRDDARRRTVLDPLPRDIATRRGWSCSRGGRRRDDPKPVRFDSLRHVARPSSTASSVRATGSSRTRGSRAFEDELRAPHRGRRSDRPGRSGSRRPVGADVLPLSPFERAARSSTSRRRRHARRA
jgi:hypothetical protein